MKNAPEIYGTLIIMESRGYVPSSHERTYLAQWEVSGGIKHAVEAGEHDPVVTKRSICVIDGALVPLYLAETSCDEA